MTKPTFIGPISSERSIATGQRVSSYYFLLLQTGSEPLKLEYPSRRVAVAARKHLLNSSSAFAVSSAKLLQAIYAAMQESASHTGERTKPARAQKVEPEIQYLLPS